MSEANRFYALDACGPLLLASYHYLVRSTFVGSFLNGRKYPRSGSAGAAPPVSAF